MWLRFARGLSRRAAFAGFRRGPRARKEPSRVGLKLGRAVAVTLCTRLYLAVATVLGVLYVGWGLAGLRPEAGARWARSLFFVSMPYLLALFAALVIDAQ